MPVSIDIPNTSDEIVFHDAMALLHKIDAVFSPYKSTSEVSRYNTGLIKKTAFSVEMRQVHRLCQRFKRLTNGYFDAYYHGHYDPSGLVKTWAMTHVAALIESHGYTEYLINIAGDIISAGEQKSWQIAIQNPWHHNKILGIVSMHNSSIATSGSYERGEHIINPHTKLSTTDLVSVTVHGNDAITADVYATACIAMGYDMARAFMAQQSDYSALLVKKDGTELSINNFPITRTKNVLL